MTDNPLPANDSDKTYETAVSELETILSQLEANELPLEDAIKQFEEGVALVKHCQGILDITEQKIKNLTGENHVASSDSNELHQPQEVSVYTTTP